jgi:hypothetical protein
LAVLGRWWLSDFYRHVVLSIRHVVLAIDRECRAKTVIVDE